MVVKFIKHLFGLEIKLRLSSSKGFTLIEVVVVAGITVAITSFLISTFANSRSKLEQSMNLFVADLRAVQLRAVSNNIHQGTYRCGFGVRHSGSAEYRIYTGPNAGVVNCSTQNRNYNSGDGDQDVQTKQLHGDSEIQFKDAFSDMFFEPPDPKTYLNNNAALDAPPQQIVLSADGADCDLGEKDERNCRSICIYTSGRIDAASGTQCP